MIEALLCKRCSGSLPAPGDDSPFVACPYCGTTHMISAPRLELPPITPGGSEYEKKRAAADAAWDQANATSKRPEVALHAAVAVFAINLKDEQEAERSAALAESALASFDKANKTQTLRDKVAALRIAEAATKAIVELRSVQATELNLPFLTATGQGPLHLQQRVTRDMLAQLDQPAVSAAPEPAKKKKKWWQFGD